MTEPRDRIAKAFCEVYEDFRIPFEEVHPDHLEGAYGVADKLVAAGLMMGAPVTGTFEENLGAHCGITYGIVDGWLCMCGHPLPTEPDESGEAWTRQKRQSVARAEWVKHIYIHGLIADPLFYEDAHSVLDDSEKLRSKFAELEEDRDDWRETARIQVKVFADHCEDHRAIVQELKAKLAAREVMDKSINSPFVYRELFDLLVVERDRLREEVGRIKERYNDVRDWCLPVGDPVYADSLQRVMDHIGGAFGE